MTREQIEKAAKENASTHFGLINKEWWARKNGFEDGAQWRINVVWHDRIEKPDTSKELILMYPNGSVRVTLLNPNLTFEGFLSVDMFIKWAYVLDLLPDRKEKI